MPTEFTKRLSHTQEILLKASTAEKGDRTPFTGGRNAGRVASAWYRTAESLRLKGMVTVERSGDARVARATDNGRAYLAWFDLLPVLIQPRTVYTGEGAEIDCSTEIARHTVGSTYVVHAGAPGIGKTVYRITAIDARGLWGEVLVDTTREMDPSEAR